MTTRQSNGQPNTPSKIEPWPKLKMFNECSLGELVRINIGSTEWALIGQIDGRRCRQIFILPKTNARPPRCFDATVEMVPKEQPFVLSYEHRYRFVPDHNGQCDVHSGSLFNAVGSLLLSKSDCFIWTWFKQPGSTSRAYYNIDSGMIDGDRSVGASVAFERWSLWLDPPEEKRPPHCAEGFAEEAIRFRVVEFTAKPTPPADPPN